jgi:uncharacterized membrane protein
VTNGLAALKNEGGFSFPVFIVYLNFSCILSKNIVGSVMSYYRELMGSIGTAVDAVGVLVIVVGAIFATGRFLFRRHRGAGQPYRLLRQDLGRAILLGLEFLIAGDIIRTVVVSPTLENVLILGLIVLIRTFLSMALQVEVEGRWPWQRAEEACPLPPGNHNNEA